MGEKVCDFDDFEAHLYPFIAIYSQVAKKTTSKSFQSWRLLSNMVSFSSLS